MEWFVETVVALVDKSLDGLPLLPFVGDVVACDVNIFITTADVVVVVVVVVAVVLW